jgi:hypothetical protein
MLTKIYKNHIFPIFHFFKISGCYTPGPGATDTAWFGTSIANALARKLPLTFSSTNFCSGSAEDDGLPWITNSSFAHSLSHIKSNGVASFQ